MADTHLQKRKIQYVYYFSYHIVFSLLILVSLLFSVIQFCSTAFAYYAQATAAQEIFGHTLQSLRGIKYLYKWVALLWCTIFHSYRACVLCWFGWQCSIDLVGNFVKFAGTMCFKLHLLFLRDWPLCTMLPL